MRNDQLFDVVMIVWLDLKLDEEHRKFLNVVLLNFLLWERIELVSQHFWRKEIFFSRRNRGEKRTANDLKVPSVRNLNDEKKSKNVTGVFKATRTNRKFDFDSSLNLAVLEWRNFDSNWHRFVFLKERKRKKSLLSNFKLLVHLCGEPREEVAGRCRFVFTEGERFGTAAKNQNMDLFFDDLVEERRISLWEQVSTNEEQLK